MESSGIYRTHLLNTKPEFDTPQPSTQPQANHADPTIDDLHIQEENRDTDGDSDEKISTNENDCSQVLSSQSINRGLEIRQPEIRRTFDETKALLPRSFCSTSALTAAAFQKASVKSPLLHGRRSDDESSDTADTTNGAVPIKDFHTSNRTRNPVSLAKYNGIQSSDILSKCNRTTKSSKLSNDDKKSAFDTELHKWEDLAAYTEVQANSVPPDANVTGSRLVHRKKMDGSAKARIVPWAHGEKTKFFRCDALSIFFELFRVTLSIAAEKLWYIGQIALETAFLQAHGFNPVIYVIPPHEAESVGSLWNLELPAYGLTDSGGLWYLTSNDVLINLRGVTRSKLDYSLYYLGGPNQ